jgi:hypothetical protein
MTKQGISFRGLLLELQARCFKHSGLFLADFTPHFPTQMALLKKSIGLPFRNQKTTRQRRILKDNPLCEKVVKEIKYWTKI